MESQNDKKQSINNNENESTANRYELCSPNDENIAFVPIENIRAIEKVITNWEAVKNLWKQTQSPSPHGGDFHQAYTINN